VVDLGSKNGVLLRAQGGPALHQIKPHEPADLANVNFEFYLSPYVKVEIAFEAIHDPVDYRGSSNFTGSVLGNRSMLLDQPPPALGGSGPAGHGSAPPNAPLPPLPGMPAAGNFPAGGSYPPPHGMPGAHPGPQRRPSASTAFFQNLGPEVLALQGLRELASSLLPGSTLDTTGDVARFITKAHDALDVFFRSFVLLRDGYAQFVNSLDLKATSQRSAFSRSAQRSPAYVAVETATTAEAVAKALLSPRDPSFDAPQAVEGIFADLMLHQMAVLEGMMKGVRALLEELSPENIEKQSESSLPLFRYKALWESYARRFEDLYEERQTFAYIFGPEFTAAYRQYRKHPPGGTP
jgi:hypothetical protein